MASEVPPPASPLGPPADPTWPPGYVTKIVGDASTQAGQIVVIHGVEHQVDALGSFVPPLPEARAGAMAEPSPRGTRYRSRAGLGALLALFALVTAGASTA